MKLFEPNNKRTIKDRIVIILLLFIIFVAGFTVVLFRIPEMLVKTEFNFVEYKATFSELEVVDNEGSVYASIYVEEYDTELLISYRVLDDIGLNQLRTIQKGDTITFVIDEDLGKINEVKFTYLRSLKTDTQSFFSTEDYELIDDNEGIYKTISFLMLIDIIIIVYNVILLVIQIKNKRKTV